MELGTLIRLQSLVMRIHLTLFLGLLIALMLLVAPRTSRRYPFFVQLGFPGSERHLARDDLPSFRRYWWWLRLWALFGLAGIALVSGLHIAVVRAISQEMLTNSSRRWPTHLGHHDVDRSAREP
jgi:hypothetical protein